jgi:hypothetical protein
VVAIQKKQARGIRPLQGDKMLHFFYFISGMKMAWMEE